MLVEYKAWGEANKVIEVPDDYTHFDQMLTNFYEQIMETRPWMLAIPIVMLMLALGVVWGSIRLVRRLVG
jgi:hypothetical protein